MIDIYTLTHLHSQATNTVMNEVPSNFKDYLAEIKLRNGIKGLIFTEHGNAVNWYKKYKAIKSEGLKYIHAVEAYICEDENDKTNSHILIYALNYNGFREVNNLISLSYKRDGHFYKRPRIYVDELLECKNIAISTACSAGILKNKNNVLFEKVIDWGIKNSNKFFLEIQPHNFDFQKPINDLTIELSKKYNLMLIATNDIHYTNKFTGKIKKILQVNKSEEIGDEGDCDLSVLSYDDILNQLVQVGINVDMAKNALNNTNILYDMCQEYDINKDYKYPQIYDNPKSDLTNMAMKKLDEFGLINNEYINRMAIEMKAIEMQKALSYIKLFSDWLIWCKKNGIGIGFSRGSSSGSVVAWLSDITGVDSIKWATSFDRFMNVNRMSLADIDVDIAPSQRQLAKSFFYNHKKLNSCDILALGTVKSKSACDIISRVNNFDKPTSKQFKEAYGDIREELNLSSIRGEIEADDDDIEEERLIDSDIITVEELKGRMRNINPLFEEAIEEVVLLEGCIVSQSSHPAGVLVVDKTIDLSKEIGLLTMEDKKNGGFKVVSQLDMKELDELGYVKADALGLANVEVIKRTCDLIGIDFPNPQEFNFYDEKVWEHMLESPVTIFQFENPSAHDYLKKALEKVPLNKKLHTMSMMSGLIRPSGASVRKRFLSGLMGDNGHPAIDKAFDLNSGYIVYQEDISKFLTMFCGYDYAKADITRKLIAKKTSGDEFNKNMEVIKNDFNSYFPLHYEATQEQMDNVIKNFLEIVKNAQDYSFSYNHSISYTMIGYICAYLRYYYPLEYLTSSLIVFSDKKDKMKEIYNYINNNTDINIKNPKYPLCKIDYSFDKKNNVIYEGMAGAKGVNKYVEEAFNNIKGYKPDNILDLWIHIKDSDTKNIGKTEMLTLNKMGFFSEIDGQIRNHKTIELLTGKSAKYKYDNKQKPSTIEKKLEAIKEIINSFPDGDFSDFEQAIFDLQIFGHTDKRFESMEEIYYVVSVEKPYSKYIIKLYNISNGEFVVYKGKNIPKPEADTVINIINRELKPDYYVSGKHSNGSPKFETTGEKSWNIIDYQIIDI